MSHFMVGSLDLCCSTLYLGSRIAHGNPQTWSHATTYGSRTFNIDKHKGISLVFSSHALSLDRSDILSSVFSIILTN